MDADLYDEFGNYIGPELESEDEEEESFSERQPDTQEYDECHHLDVQQAEELHRLEMERLRLKMEFDAEMHHETLQTAKVKRLGSEDKTLVEKVRPVKTRPWSRKSGKGRHYPGRAGPDSEDKTLVEKVQAVKTKTLVEQVWAVKTILWKMADVPSKSPESLLVNKLNRGKKRKINYEWKQVKNKHLKDSGMAYLGSKGIAKPAKKPPDVDDLCSGNCTYNGCSWLNGNLTQKLMLYNMFYGVPYNQQQQFLAECINLREPQRRTVSEIISKRHCTVKRLQLLVEKVKSGKSVNDDRGKHKNRPRNLLDADKALVEEHIRSFPSQESHYSRHSNKAKYLSPDLSISKMFNLFKSKYPESKVLLHTYRLIFREKFDLKFGLPRSDTCKTCDKYFIQMAAAHSEEEQKKLQVESELHHRKAEKAYNTLANAVKDAQENPNLIVLFEEMEGHFIDFAPVDNQIYKHPNLKISECRWIQFSKDSPTEIRTRKCHSILDAWRVFNVLKKKNGKTTNVDNLYRKVQLSELNNLYPGPKLPINSAKKADLVKISEYLPPEHRAFYLSLTCAV
uniref:116kDa U5 small nuclear ribonucleoprotein component N-terminal domain-containing protein n=1 Tax=Timema monikensis TaxID=170555 RepID=A0A7R9E9P0_9NEOP|nr:unnamed protein product [Timema monikensis]